MTLPLYLCVHLVYGALMAYALYPRMRVEGELLGLPLLFTLAPVAVVTIPAGSVLLRYAGGWFLHGALVGSGAIDYERFHFGLMMLVGLLAAACTVGGMFFVLATVSRDRVRLARAPFALAGLVALLTLALDGGGVFRIAGSQGRHLWSHPTGLLSIAIALVLYGAWRFAQLRVAPIPSLTSR